MSDRRIYGVIGVWHRGDETFYVRRSKAMENYPDVWSLLSIQYDPVEVPDHLDLDAVQPLMERMARERLGGVGIHVDRYLTSAACAENPMNKLVFLHMYQIHLDSLPKLNPEFYAAAEWMTPDQYVERSQNATCGLCMKMWSDYCTRNNLAERPFAPVAVVNEADYE